MPDLSSLILLSYDLAFCIEHISMKNNEKLEVSGYQYVTM